MGWTQRVLIRNQATVSHKIIRCFVVLLNSHPFIEKRLSIIPRHLEAVFRGERNFEALLDSLTGGNKRWKERQFRDI